MTPRAPSRERVEELRGKFQYQKDIMGTVKGNPALGRVMLLDIRDYDDLLVILDGYSALKAENERLQKQVEIEQRKVSDLDGLLAKYHEAAENAEAQLEKVKADFSEALKIGYDQQADLEKFRPLIEAVMGAGIDRCCPWEPMLDYDPCHAWIDDSGKRAILREALKLREEGK